MKKFKVNIDNANVTKKKKKTKTKSNKNSYVASAATKVVQSNEHTFQDQGELKRKKQNFIPNDVETTKKMKKQSTVEDNEITTDSSPMKSKKYKPLGNESSQYPGTKANKKRKLSLGDFEVVEEVSPSKNQMKLKKSRTNETSQGSESTSHNFKEDASSNHTKSDARAKKRKKNKSNNAFEIRSAGDNNLDNVLLNTSSKIKSIKKKKSPFKVQVNGDKFISNLDKHGCRPPINDTNVSAITNGITKKTKKKKKNKTTESKGMVTNCVDDNSTKLVGLPHSSSEMKSSTSSKKSKKNQSVTAKTNADRFKSNLNTNRNTIANTSVDSVTSVGKTKKKKKKTNNKETVQETQQVVATDSDSDDEVSTEPITLPPLSVSTGFVWVASPNMLPAGAPVDGIEEESSDDEVVETKKVKRSRQAIIAEKRLQAQMEEARLRSIEQRLMDPEQLPQTADEFDRLVLSSPDNSMVWLQYMAYHIQATEIEKARSIAQRALKTISFREEREKLNVWMAWLNLENLYGTHESMQSTLQEAIRLNEPYEVYTQTLQIYADSHKLQDGDELIAVMTRKFKTIKDMWVNVATFYMKSGQTMKARALLQRALASLDKKEHISVITQFALLENKLGSKERAQTLMEQILTSYPKRVDVWSVYVDMLVKCDLFDMARQVLERAVAQRLPSHKMKTLFKKFLAFEEAHGTEEGANKVRQLALDYVEAAAGTTME